MNKFFVLHRKNGVTSAFKILPNGRVAVGRSYRNNLDVYNREEGEVKAFARLEAFLKRRTKEYWTKYKQGKDENGKQVETKGHQLFVTGTPDVLHPEERQYYENVIKPRLDRPTTRSAAKRAKKGA